MRVHRKLRDAGVTADLVVFEGTSHAQYLFNADALETRQHFADLGAFFDRTWRGNTARVAPSAEDRRPRVAV